MSVSAGALKDGARELGLILSDDQIGALVAYAEMLEKWNKKFNLVSRQDIRRLGTRHLLDSLTGVSLLQGSRIMDLGSGAGLPGIPLAIAEPARTFWLCDRSQRRTRFLHQVVSALGLDNIRVWQGDYGKERPDTPHFDTVVARGVATASQVWAMVQPQLSSGGTVLVYESTQKVDEDSAEEPQVAIVSPPDNPSRDQELEYERHDFDVPGLDQTHTIVSAKVGNPV